MAFSNGIYLMSQAVTRFKSDIRKRMTSSLTVLGGVVLLACALGFGLASAYMALAREMPDYLAALWVTFGLVLLGAAVIAFAIMRRPGRTGSQSATRPGSDQPIKTGDPLQQVTDAFLLDAAGRVRQEPLSTMSSALLLGLVVGLLRQNDNR